MGGRVARDSGILGRRQGQLCVAGGKREEKERRERKRGLRIEFADRELEACGSGHARSARLGWSPAGVVRSASESGGRMPGGAGEG